MGDCQGCVFLMIALVCPTCWLLYRILIFGVRNLNKIVSSQPAGKILARLSARHPCAELKMAANFPVKFLRCGACLAVSRPLAAAPTAAMLARKPVTIFVSATSESQFLTPWRSHNSQPRLSTSTPCGAGKAALPDSTA